MWKKLTPILLTLTLLISCGVNDTPATSTAIPIAILIASPTSLPEATQFLTISRHPDPAILSGNYPEIAAIPKYDPNSDKTFQVDLRSKDLTKVDMTNSLADLIYADFDSKTKWPPADKIPTGFSHEQIMELGKDPGLGIRALHSQGITGKGIGIAIIDQTLLVDHVEYLNQLRLYEEPETRDRGMYARMHGPAVASIAVGQTVGVAPNADLYYLASPSCFDDNDFICLARSVRRVIEINRTLPQDNKIRALSISRGWLSTDYGYTDIMNAVREAGAEGIFVISSSLRQTNGLDFQGLGRNPSNDPNFVESFLPGIWWAKYFYEGMPLENTLLIPMDSRTTASPTGVNDYVYYSEGGWSWSIPYIAGMYALAAQVKPDITPEEFWSTALATGKTIQLNHQGKDYSFGIILDPQTLIAALQK